MEPYDSRNMEPYYSSNMEPYYSSNIENCNPSNPGHCNPSNDGAVESTWQNDAPEPSESLQYRCSNWYDNGRPDHWQCIDGDFVATPTSTCDKCQYMFQDWFGIDTEASQNETEDVKGSNGASSSYENPSSPATSGSYGIAQSSQEAFASGSQSGSADFDDSIVKYRCQWFYKTENVHGKMVPQCPSGLVHEHGYTCSACAVSVDPF